MHVFVDFHNSGFVSASVAVVGRTENSHHIAVVRPIVTIHHKLMGAGDAGQTVVVVELFRNVLTERIAGTTGRNSPAAPVIGVGPKQIANGTFVGNFLDAIQLTDLV